jgi:UDP-glucose 4-epimerase
MTFRNKTVLITGADGFIGSHLTEALVQEGAKCQGTFLLQFLQQLGMMHRYP